MLSGDVRGMNQYERDSYPTFGLKESLWIVAVINTIL